MSNSRLCRPCRSLTGRRRVYLNRHHISHQSWIEKVRLDLFFALFGFHVPFRLQLTLPFALFLQHARLTFHVTFCPRCLQCDSCDFLLFPLFLYPYWDILCQVLYFICDILFALYLLLGFVWHVWSPCLIYIIIISTNIICYLFKNYRNQTVRCTKNPIYIFPEKE